MLQQIADGGLPSPSLRTLYTPRLTLGLFRCHFTLWFSCRRAQCLRQSISLKITATMSAVGNEKEKECSVEEILLHVSQITLDGDQQCSRPVRGGQVGGVIGGSTDFCCLVFLMRLWFPHRIADM